MGYVRIVTDQYAFQHYSPILFYWNFSPWWLMKLSSGPLLCSSLTEHAVVNVMGCNRRNKFPKFCWWLRECPKHLEPSVWLGALISSGTAVFIHWLLCIWWKKEVLKECTSNRPEIWGKFFASGPSLGHKESKNNSEQGSRTANLCSTFLGAKRSLPLTLSPIPNQVFLLTLSIFTMHLPQHYLSHAAFSSEPVK